MDNFQTAIYVLLTVNPGSMFVTPDGQSLYALAEGGLMHFTGANFSEMNEAELNEFIVKTLSR